jgi:arabinofuranosyltransferase
MLARLVPGRLPLYGTLVLFLLASLPIPWLHWHATRDLRTRKQTFALVQPLADRFAPPFDIAVSAWDRWQRWLIVHNVCRRHQEHRLFAMLRSHLLPPRSEGEQISWDERAVYADGSVGVVGWVFPNVAIIDRLGLNDHVVARLPVPPKMGGRQMAHDRRAPEAYIDCFRPNLQIEPVERRAWVEPRILSDDEIRACEARDWNGGLAAAELPPG